MNTGIICATIIIGLLILGIIIMGSMAVYLNYQKDLMEKSWDRLDRYMDKLGNMMVDVIKKIGEIEN